MSDTRVASRRLARQLRGLGWRVDLSTSSVPRWKIAHIHINQRTNLFGEWWVLHIVKNGGNSSTDSESAKESLFTDLTHLGYVVIPNSTFPDTLTVSL